MVYPNEPIKCDCSERIGSKITSQRDFEELIKFFEQQVDLHVFREVPVQKPFYVWHHVRHCADKWYKCNVCGCLWEFIYPDFPAVGRVRKFSSETEYIDETKEIEQTLIKKGKLHK